MKTNQAMLSVVVIGSLILLTNLESAALAPKKKIDTPTLRLIEKIGPAYDVPVRFFKALVCQESSCGADIRPRREQSKSWSKEAGRIAGKNKARYEALMRSYGATQLSGVYTYKEYKIEPHKLHDDETNLELAAAKLRKLFVGCRSSELCVAAKWNGGNKPNQAARQYAREVMEWKQRI